MISNINSNYESICKLFNFSEESTADIFKKKLLEIASNKKNERPPQKTKEGQRLSAYTGKLSPCYDEKFTNKIKKIRPDWFVTPQERKDANKKMFLEMAARGEKRPNKHKDLKGAIFSSYVNPSQPTFDKKFRDQIKKINPSWIEKKSDIRKKELLKLAKTKKPKPHWRTPLGIFFNDHVCKRSKRYFDLEFYEKLKKLKPDWFVSPNKKADDARSKILNLAKNKKLSKKEIKKIIGRTFLDYFKKNLPKNIQFLKKLKKIRPDFFVSRSDVATQDKQKIIDLAKNNINPNWKTKSERTRFYNWMTKDKKFREEIIKLSPIWYSPAYKTKQKIEKTKKKIILIAKSGRKRPVQKDYTGGLLTQLTTKTGKRYDFKFHSNLKKLRPDWFKK